jgi:putative DNA primase/helicase
VTQTAGAGTWRPEHNSRFKGRDVAIAYDADLAGWKGALKVANNLAGVAASVRVIRWPDFMLPQDAPEGDYSDRLPETHGQDLTDFFARHKRSVDDLMDLLAEAQEVKPAAPPAPRAGEQQPEGAGLERFRAWSDLDLKVNFRPLLMVQEILAECRICTERESGVTYLYNESQGVWEPAPIEVIKRLVMAKMGIAASRNRVGEAAEMIQTLSMLEEGQEMDRDAYMVNLLNGMVDLRTWEIQSHAPGWRSTYQHPFEFDPAKPVDCPYFKAGLFKTIQIGEVIQEVQEFTGYCLLRDYPFHKALFLLGGGNDGKSKFLEVLRVLVGQKRCAAINMRDLEDQFLRVMLHRALLNVFTEASAEFFHNDHFKALTGGDWITAAYKHEQAFTFKSACKHAFSMNALPRMADKSFALYRRILPVKFRHRFRPGDEDPYVLDKFLAELPGIFQWALVGLRRLLDRGKFQDSPTTKAVLAEYQDLNNVLRLFVEECCLKGDGHQVAKQNLYDKYKAWHEDAGLKNRMDKPRFFRELKAMDELEISERRLTIGDGRARVIEGLTLA